MQSSYKGQTVIVTGGAMGIGYALCEAFGLKEANVVAIDNNAEALGFAVERLKNLGVRIRSYCVDVCDIPSMRNILEQCFSLYGHIDVLVNSAGVIERKRSIETTERDYDFMFDTNVKAIYFACRDTAKLMIRNGRGCIINIASTASFQVEGGAQAAYGTTKHCIKHLTECLAMEYAPTLRVNAVAPGFTRTPFNIDFHESHPNILENYMKVVPLGHPEYARDMAGAALFLASDDASEITGHTLVVDGGMLLNF